MYEKKGPSYGWELRKVCKKLGYINFVEGIIDLYVNQEKSQEEIAKIFGRTQAWVCHTMQWMQLPARSQGGPNFKGKGK
jgi:hypothetical protein